MSYSETALAAMAARDGERESVRNTHTHTHTSSCFSAMHVQRIEREHRRTRTAAVLLRGSGEPALKIVAIVHAIVRAEIEVQRARFGDEHLARIFWHRRVVHDLEHPPCQRRDRVHHGALLELGAVPMDEAAVRFGETRVALLLRLERLAQLRVEGRRAVEVPTTRSTWRARRWD